MRATIIVAFLAISVAGAPEAAGDLNKFQGSWQLISAELDGKKTPDADAKRINLTIQGNKFVPRKDDKVLSEGTFTLSPDRKPKEIDETLTAGPRKGKTFRAIYEIDDKQHRICFAADGKERPTEFAAPVGSGRLLQLWRRQITK